MTAFPESSFAFVSFGSGDPLAHIGGNRFVEQAGGYVKAAVQLGGELEAAVEAGKWPSMPPFWIHNPCGQYADWIDKSRTMHHDQLLIAQYRRAPWTSVVSLRMFHFFLRHVYEVPRIVYYVGKAARVPWLARKIWLDFLLSLGDGADAGFDNTSKLDDPTDMHGTIEAYNEDVYYLRTHGFEGRFYIEAYPQLTVKPGDYHCLHGSLANQRFLENPQNAPLVERAHEFGDVLVLSASKQIETPDLLKRWAEEGKIPLVRGWR
jgi:hypothetical protein